MKHEALRPFITQRPELANWLGLGLLLLVLATAVGWNLNDEHERTLAREAARLASQARVVTDNLEAHLRATRDVLDLLRESAGGKVDGSAAPAGDASTETLAGMVRAMTGIRTVIVTDAQGVAIASNRAELVGQNFASRNYFQTAQQAGNDALLLVSPPFKTVLGVWGMNVTRARPPRQGAFDGVVTATLDPSYFSTLLHSVLYESGVWATLAHGDGLLFVAEPEGAAAPGHQLAQEDGYFSAHLASGQTTSLFTGTVAGGTAARLVAVRSSQTAALTLNRPLVVAISRDLHATLAEWRRMAWVQGGFTLLFALASALGLALYQRRARDSDRQIRDSAERLARNAERLALATKASGIAVWDWDLVGGQLVWDRSMHSLYELDGDTAPRDWSAWLTRIAPEDQPAAQAAMLQSLDAGTALLQRFRIRPRAGQERLIEAHANVYLGPDGRPARLVGTNQDVTDREATAIALQRSQAELHEAQRMANMGSWWLDLASHQVSWTPQLFRMTGQDPLRPPPDFTDQAALFSPESWERLNTCVALARTEGTSYELELEMVRADGSKGWMQARGEAVRDAQGRIVALHGVAMDITASKRAEQRLQLSANVFSHTHEAIMITDAQRRIIEVNEGFTRITGYTREEALGRSPSLLSSGRQGDDFYSTLWQNLQQTGHWSGEIWNRRKSGEIYAELLTISSIANAQGEVQQYVALFSDITALKSHQSELEHIAHFDALTGLPNRVLLADRLQQAMAHAHRRQQRIAVAFLDLDGFKAVNDTHGHDVGDQLLIAVAQRMKDCLREGDTLARLGGDEFVAVLLDLPEGEQGLPLVARLVTRAAEPIVVGPHVMGISVSAGVTFFPQAEEVDGDQLLRQADLAMYQAKLAGKNRFSLFDAEHDRSVRTLNQELADVHTALKEQQFVLHYQPKVNMRSGQLLGVEALIRWQQPGRGLVYPGQFLPQLESHGVIAQIGEWVIETALAQAEAWRREGLRVNISVNIAGQQLLQPEFTERLRALLAAHPEVEPAQLELEVLESSALGDLAHVARVIESCTQMGVGFAIDDFGTGYSSLTYLKRLNARLIKIDQSFVRDMLDDPEDLAILEGVLDLARAFRRAVIAEGVETVAHGETLLRLGCELGQGYGIARPMPAADYPLWAASWRPDARWTRTQTLDAEGRAQLVAVVEHRAWIAGVEATLNQRRDAMPPLDVRACRFGQWLDARRSKDSSAALARVDQLHREVHALVLHFQALHQNGQGSLALERLGELHARRDALLAALGDLAPGPGA